MDDNSEACAEAGGGVVTVGVEEEYFLVRADTRAAVPAGPRVADRATGELGDLVAREFTDLQVEVRTTPCTTVDDVHAQVLRLRKAVAASATTEGVRACPSGTPVISGGCGVPVGDHARYQAGVELFRSMMDDFAVCALHVHVFLPDRDVAALASNHLRVWLPLLVEMSANSPFHDGRDTGFASWRSVMRLGFPSLGPPPYVESFDDYRRTAAAMADAGGMSFAELPFWDIRPHPRLPTLEARSPMAATAPAPTDQPYGSPSARPARPADDTRETAAADRPDVRRDGYARLRAADLGVDTDALAGDLAQFAHGYQDLPADPYAPDTNRRRRYSHAVYLPWNGELSFVPGIPDPAFGTVTEYWQDEHNPEFPRVRRRLPDIPPALQGNRLLNALIRADLEQALWLKELHHAPLYIGVHMITLSVSGRQQVAVSSPNCLHQDGGSPATFTFAHLIGCHDISGGENAIATPESAGRRPDTLPPHALHTRFMMTEPLDGYGVHDHRVSHYVAPVHLADGKNSGRRDILIIGIAPYTPGL